MGLQVTAAMRLADGVLLVVDVLEGVGAATERAIQQAVQEGLAITMLVSKVRRCALARYHVTWCCNVTSLCLQVVFSVSLLSCPSGVFICSAHVCLAASVTAGGQHLVVHCLLQLRAAMPLHHLGHLLRCTCPKLAAAAAAAAAAAFCFTPESRVAD
jgi:hypothetical protein